MRFTENTDHSQGKNILINYYKGMNDEIKKNCSSLGSEICRIFV